MDMDERSSRALLWAVTSASTLLKLAFLLAVPAVPVADETQYLALARELAASGRFGGKCFRPPLYPAYIALMDVLGLGEFGALIVQILISSASVWVAYDIVLRGMPYQAAEITVHQIRRCALLAALLLAFDPVLVFFARTFWTETLFIFFLLLMIDLLLAGSASGRLRFFGAAGVVLGIGGLTRPVILPASLLLAIWVVFVASGPHGIRRTWRNALARVAVLAAAAILIVAPWTIRNALVEHAFVLVDSNGPFNFHVGNNPDFMTKYVRGEGHRSWDNRWGLVDGRHYNSWLEHSVDVAQRRAIDRAFLNIAQHPGLAARKVLWAAGDLWQLDNFLIRHLRWRAFDQELPKPVAVGLATVSVSFTVVITLTGLIGLAIGRPAPLRSMVLLLFLHFTLVSMATYTLSRYGVPFRPLLAFYAAYVLLHPRQSLSQLARFPSRPTATVVLLAALIAIGVVWTRDVAWSRFSITQTAPHD